MPPEWVNELLKHDFISSKFPDYILYDFDPNPILDFYSKERQRQQQHPNLHLRLGENSASEQAKKGC